MSFTVEFRDWSCVGSRIQYGHVPWDSEIFGFPFYQVTVTDVDADITSAVHELLQHLPEQRADRYLAYAKVPSHDVHILQMLTAAGFYPVETLIEPYRDLTTFEAGRRFERLRLRAAEADDRPYLLEIARQAFSKDRYHLDPNLPSDRADHRYTFWVDNALTASDPVLVYEDPHKGLLLGFCHLRELADGIVDFSLGAIDPTYQKAGFGLMMYSECLLECRRRGYTRMTTRISVNNVGVLNIYAKLGFLFRTPVSTLHAHGAYG